MIKHVEIRTRLVSKTGETEEEMRSECHGTWQQVSDRHLFRYAEPDNNGSALLLIERGTAHLRRTGSTHSKMHFEVGRKANAYYRTAAGPVHMALRTHELRTDTATDSGYIELRYDVLIGGQKAAENALRIEWVEV